MEWEDLAPGVHVWSVWSTWGWQAATVVRCTPTRVRLQQASNPARGCWRKPYELRPRDPERAGADKPTQSAAWLCAQRREMGART